jgi:hypothetical protein
MQLVWDCGWMRSVPQLPPAKALAMRFSQLADRLPMPPMLPSFFLSDLRLFCVDMRNTYTTLHDLLLKNEERINNPNLEGESGRNRRHAFA